MSNKDSSNSIETYTKVICFTIVGACLFIITDDDQWITEQIEILKMAYDDVAFEHEGNRCSRGLIC